MAPPNDPTPVPTPPQVDPATFEAAFRRVQPRLEALRPPLRTARADYYTAIIRGLAAARAANGELKPRFLALPTSEFDPSSLELLTDSAHALLKARLDAETAMLAVSKAKLAGSVVQASLELKERTLALLNYHLRDDEAVTRETADIARGRGYVDLANDLGRLARLLRDHQDTLKTDTRLFQPENAGRCEELSHRILEDLGSEQNPEQRRRMDTLSRCWTLFERTYDEVAQTGRWLLRADERRAEQTFPSLYAFSHPRRGGIPRRQPRRRDERTDPVIPGGWEGHNLPARFRRCEEQGSNLVPRLFFAGSEVATSIRACFSPEPRSSPRSALVFGPPRGRDLPPARLVARAHPSPPDQFPD